MKKKYLLIAITFLFCFSLFPEDSESLIPKKTKTENEYFITGTEGDIIYSLGEGVVDIGFDNIKGLYITADYNSLGIKVTYCNLGTISVSKKQKIKKGDKLGSIGMTGYTDKTGCSIIIEIDEDLFLFQNSRSYDR